MSRQLRTSLNLQDVRSLTKFYALAMRSTFKQLASGPMAHLLLTVKLSMKIVQLVKTFFGILPNIARPLALYVVIILIAFITLS